MAIRWTPLLAVGVGTIDAGHRELFALANRLLEALGAGRPGEASGLLAEIDAFASQHFRAEEALMAGAGYPELEEHRGSHAALRCELAGLRGELDGSGVAGELASRTNHFVFDWLLVHISRDDRAFGDWSARHVAPGWLAGA